MVVCRLRSMRRRAFAEWKKVLDNALYQKASIAKFFDLEIFALELGDESDAD